jgi:predicted O-linked N-acetylglucosamine transferase (SPINDLY family)
MLFAMHLSDSIDAAELLREHQRWATRFAKPLVKQIPVHANDRSPERMLRIGYVSPDLHDHPVATFLLPILETHARQQFHITCYNNSWIEDEMTGRLRAVAQTWRLTPDWTDERLARQIVEDRIDILVDLAQHSDGNRILFFARKPAPVQVTYLGYPGTTGLGTFDGRLSDPHIDPLANGELFSTEPIERLPETFWCLRPIPAAPLVAPPPAIQRGTISFGCLNKFAKVSPAALRFWATILHRVPESRLMLSAPPGDHRQRILDVFGANGVSSERIEFVAKQCFPDFLALHHQIDIALDPFPYNGGTTTCYALWMGVPVITLAGTTGVQRSGASLLSNVGLPELIATTQEQYVQVAIDLAGDLRRLSELRVTLRDRMTASPLMDVPRFVGNLEAIYRRLWRKWCDQ